MDYNDYSKRCDESEYEYIYRICSLKDCIGTWEDVAEVLNKELHYEYTSSKYRKAYQSFVKMFEENKNRFSNNGNKNGYASELARQKRELEIEKQKVRDEKKEYNQWLREQCRDELILEKICECIKELEPLSIEIPLLRDKLGKCREAVFCFGDTHFGTEFEIKGFDGEILNKYSPEIFKARMERLMAELLVYIQEKGITTLKVLSLGDEIDGILRVSQLMKLRYGVVDSAIAYAEYISNWLYELSKYVYVKFYTAQGNHTELRQLGQPKGTFVNDNMSKVINAYIKTRLADDENFEFFENENNMIFSKVCGFNLVAIHGEVKNLASALKNITNLYNKQIDILVGGHMHHFNTETIGVCRDVVSVPSIMGIDDYSVSLGRGSSAGALLFIVEEDYGIVEYRHFRLK